jgi:hypothetical protein
LVAHANGMSVAFAEYVQSVRSNSGKTEIGNWSI